MAKRLLEMSVAAALLLAANNVVCSAKETPSETAPVQAASAATPELKAADERVDQAKAQRATARKQLSAARALLKAAEADFKAACAEREALALKTTAQDLADASGLQQVAAPGTPVKSSGLGIAQKVPGEAKPQTDVDLSQTRIQQFDFNAEPVPQGQLR